MTPKWRDPQWWLLLAYLPFWCAVRALARRLNSPRE
mgnify:CR=1 FL=1